MTKSKDFGIILSFAKEFLDNVGGDELPNDIKELVVAAIAHGATCALDATVNGYDFPDGTNEPVSMIAMLEEAGVILDIFYDEDEDIDEDDDEEDRDEEASDEATVIGNHSQQKTPVGEAQFEIETQVEPEGTSTRHDWVELSKLTNGKKAN